MGADTAEGQAVTNALRELPAREINRLSMQLEAAAARLSPDDRSQEAYECRDALRRVRCEVRRRTKKAVLR